MGDINEGSLKNNNLYNDKELNDDADLNWYDYGFRSYDPQIGRFPQLDPLTDDYPELTPYQYASDEPIANIDIDGLEKGSAVAFAYDYASKGASFSFIAPKAASIVKAGTSALTNIAAGANVIVKIGQFAGVHSEQFGGSSPGPEPSIPFNPLRRIPTPGKVIPFNKPSAPPNIKAIAGLGILGEIGLTLVGVLLPLPAGNGSIKKPFEDRSITLYRGVHAKHPDIINARKGTATPFGGDATPEQHQGGNYHSWYTSWTMSLGVANFHANKEGPGGIVLIKKFFVGEYLPNLSISAEGEFLVPGIVTHAKPINPTGIGFPTMF